MPLPLSPRSPARRLVALGAVVAGAAALAACGPGGPATAAPAQPANRCRVSGSARILNDPALTANSPHVTVGGDRFGVVWEELEPTHAGAHLGIVRTDGSEAAVIELGLNEHARTRGVQVGGGADGFLAAWHESPKGSTPTVYLREISHAGEAMTPPLDIGEEGGDLAGVGQVDRQAVVVRTSTTLAGSQIAYSTYDLPPPGTVPQGPLTPRRRGTLSDRATAFTTIDSTSDGRQLAMAWAEPPPADTAAGAASMPSLFDVGTVDVIGPRGPLPVEHVALGEDTAITLLGDRIGVTYTDPDGNILVARGRAGGFDAPVTIGSGRGPDAAFMGNEILVCATDMGLATHVGCYLVGAKGAEEAVPVVSGVQDVDEIDVATIAHRALVVWQQAGGAGTEVFGAVVQCAPPPPVGGEGKAATSLPPPRAARAAEDSSL